MLVDVDESFGAEALLRVLLSEIQFQVRDLIQYLWVIINFVELI